MPDPRPPFRIVECEGTPYEMGLAQGRALVDSIRHSVETSLASAELNPYRGSLLDARRVLAHLGYLIDLGSRLRGGPVLRAWKERLSGIAASCGLARRLLLGLQAVEAVLISPAGVLQCTCVGVSEERSAGQGPLLLKNYDMIELFRSTTILRRSRPKKGLRTFEMALDVLAGSHTIANEAGLCLAYNYGVVNAAPRPGIPPTYLLQHVAERCRTTEEAAAELARYPTTNACLITVLDARSTLRVVEKVGVRTELRAPERGVTVATNHFLTPRLARFNYPSHAVAGGLAPRATHGMWVQKPNEERLRRARELACGQSSPPRLSSEYLMAVARDHDGKAEGDENTICRHHPYSVTLASMILVPAEQRALVCFGNPCREPYLSVPFWA